MIQDGKRYDYLYDDNGNVMALIDDAQNIVAQYSYSPFGQLQTATGPLADQPMRFSTKYYDPETGLSDFGYRFYRADVGKWLTRDPIGEAGGINLYGFVENNPVNFIDSYGYKSDWRLITCLILGLCNMTDHQTPSGDHSPPRQEQQAPEWKPKNPRPPSPPKEECPTPNQQQGPKPPQPPDPTVEPPTQPTIPWWLRRSPWAIPACIVFCPSPAY
ncbi:RHS repeat domain-containing protein [Methylocucumis oryzae]|uniref:Teneurin-like YD-shell domain-containing protein n=1 Tax=Methylocucumis oryzae TaxID=1632867 RepID=A0A0F3IGT0_9GAMM|nr:RHS repeat-associated core domain-containing protein [Methylocucumis oryzae]KJV05966.1 hypothetical protein VZ94_14420 [Methylocucumis oryzae]